MIDLININDEKIKIQENFKNDDLFEEEISQNLNETMSNLIVPNLMKPLRERIKKNIIS